MVLWDMIFWRKWNKKMVRFMMTLILAVGKSTKWMMILNLCLMTLNKILDINYTYGSMTQTMAKEIFWRLTIIFISQRMDERGGLFRAKRR